MTFTSSRPFGNCFISKFFYVLFLGNYNNDVILEEKLIHRNKINKILHTSL